MRVKKMAIMLILSLAISVIIIGCSSEKRYYNKGVKAQENKNYEEAIENFTQAGDYEDSKDRLTECTHLNDVANDKVAPSIMGLEEKIDITCGTEFNLNDYISERIKVEDNITKDIKEYSISSDEVYDRGSGIINTMENGEHEVIVTAKDEAGNKGETKFILSINPVLVTKDNPEPVIYDGEYATVKLKSFNHGEIFEYSGMIGYYAKFDVENKCDEPITVYWSSHTSINDYQVSPSYKISSVAAGKKGTTFTFFEDKDIPEEAGNFSQIDSIVCIIKDNEDKALFRIPTTFYTDAIK